MQPIIGAHIKKASTLIQMKYPWKGHARITAILDNMYLKRCKELEKGTKGDTYGKQQEKNHD